MSKFKQLLGFIWILIGLLSLYFGMFNFGGSKLVHPTGNDDLVFGIILVFILTPLVGLGLILFGYYVLKNEYE
jgi:hypothetical protein